MPLKTNTYWCIQAVLPATMPIKFCITSHGT